MAGFAGEEEMIIIIPGESSPLEVFCIQASTTPALPSALQAFVTSPSATGWTFGLLLAGVGASSP